MDFQEFNVLHIETRKIIGKGKDRGDGVYNIIDKSNNFISYARGAGTTKLNLFDSKTGNPIGHAIKLNDYQYNVYDMNENLVSIIETR